MCWNNTDDWVWSAEATHEPRISQEQFQLARAEPTDKAELYNQLGVSLRYDPEGLVAVKAQPRG